MATSTVTMSALWIWIGIVTMHGSCHKHHWQLWQCCFAYSLAFGVMYMLPTADVWTMPSWLVTVYRHYCLTHTVTQSYKWLLNILHNTESWKRPKLLCVNHQCHIDAPLWNTARYCSLACYSGSGACSLTQSQIASARFEFRFDNLFVPFRNWVSVCRKLICTMLGRRQRDQKLTYVFLAEG